MAASTSHQTCNIILIVSRDTKMASAWSMLFKQRGFYILHETTPRHAIQAAALLHPALTVIDLDLTHAERLALCAQLRALSGALLLLAAKTAEHEILEYYRAGVDERLSPAVSPMTLISKALTWLAQKESQTVIPRGQLTRVYA